MNAPSRKLKLPPLWAHQAETLKLLQKSPIVFDTSDPGTGKTRAALEAFYQRRKGKALVLAPKTLLESAWAADIARWTPALTYSVAYAENREDAFEVDADVYITNIDAVKWIAKQRKKFFDGFNTVIVDESTALKHRTSARSKAAAKVIQYFKYRELMTGTPNSNTVTDLWHQAYLLDGGERLGRSFFKFRASVCAPEQVGPQPNHIRWVDKPGAELAVADLLRDISVRHQFDECMDIPPNHTYTVEFSLPRTAYRKYTELERTALLELEKGEVAPVHAAALRTKLLQLASGAVYYKGDQYEVIDRGRYELIADLVEARRHSIVFFNWRHQRDEIAKELDERGVVYESIDGDVSQRRRTEIVEAYQAGFFQTLLLHPQTGAHGLTLTKGTATIWASPVYQADFLKQGMHRVFRGGQTERTETILIEAKNTVERLVYERVGEKAKRMDNFLDILRTRVPG
jgi:SNF2 family DNA or RNA helicase